MLHLWWLGQSGFLLQHQGYHVLLDPYLSDSLTDKYAGTDKPHVRMTARVVEPGRLDFIDAVTSSHNHTDHLDASTLTPILTANPTIRLIIPEANRAFVAERLGGDMAERLLGLNDEPERTVPMEGYLLTAVTAAHNSIERDAAGHSRYLGYVIQMGPWKIYHAGDTVRFAGMAERLRPHGIDIALLPINGDRPERGVAGNLDGVEAAGLAREIGARVVIPMHYEMFEFNTASPESFVAECRRLGQACRVLRAGERWSSGELPA